ncbi:mitochondrial calcium uniporter regulator 1-like [Ylistrum balloti]|uniref:mitochondrial calcium uniporter regulator 1-like n=1 Tax=Ylistrum balloti TaxID=509963 RepID=UPI00290586AB|nr:mitochondrial calcium uniporter regulator 1-like [Ylistrum balloti]
MLQSRRLFFSRPMLRLYATLTEDQLSRTLRCSRCIQRQMLVPHRTILSPQSKELAGSSVWVTKRGYCTNPEARSINPTLEAQSRIFYFDTQALVNKLMSQGFTQEQATAVTEAFIEVLNTSIEHQTKNMVTKSQQEITVQQLMSHIASVKKDMVKDMFSMLRSETEKQTMQIKQFQQTLQDEMGKLKNNVVLDINLEKSRSTEAHAENRKELQVLNNKIVTDTAALHTKIETYRNDVFKYAAGAVAGTATLCLGFLRLVM